MNRVYASRDDACHKDIRVMESKLLQKKTLKESKSIIKLCAKHFRFHASCSSEFFYSRRSKFVYV